MADVFISYSRQNTTFARHLIEQLTLKGKDAWVDWEGIPLTAPNWWLEIKAGIGGADSFVFIMSPDSMASVVCNMELDYAIELQKRIVPVLYQEIESRDAFASIADFEPDDAMEERLAGKDALIIARNNWQHLSHINWVYFRDEDDFETAFEKLIATVETDLEYVKAHTRYLTRAREWELRQRRVDLLLFGEEIDLAEAWLVQAERYAAEAQRTTGEKVEIVNPLPQDLQREYITTSRIAERQRQRRLRNLRWASVIAGVTGIVSLVAFGFAAIGVQQASDDSATAQVQANVANTQVGVADNQLATATLALVTATRVAELEAEGQATLGAVSTQVADAFVTVTQISIDEEIARDFGEAMLLQNVNPADQLAAMNELVERYPQHPRAYLSRALIYVVQQDLRTAIGDFDRAIELDPLYARTYNDRGGAYADLGEFQRAIVDYDRAIELDPQYVEAYYNRGKAYYSLGNYEAAIADYDQALEFDPDYGIAYANRGIAWAVQGNYEAAIADYNRAIELEPQLPITYYNRGNAYRDMGDIEAAIADYSHAIGINPDYASPYRNRGDLQFESGQIEAALSDYREYERITGQLESYMVERVQQLTPTPTPEIMANPLFVENSTITIPGVRPMQAMDRPGGITPSAICLGGAEVTVLQTVRLANGQRWVEIDCGTGTGWVEEEDLAP